MKYVIGVDLGTSSVKLLLVNQQGYIVNEVSKTYPLMQEKPGYSEQDPNDWVRQTTEGLAELMNTFTGDNAAIEGISFSGQMHGLVLLDADFNVLRPAILWNDTRTTEQCQGIYDVVGEEKLLEITKNPALEGFTLPKLLWVREHEPEIFAQAKHFLLPKDYLRYHLTGKIHMDYSDAAGTLLLDVGQQTWSDEICGLLEINPSLCPPLVNSGDKVGTITSEIAFLTGLPETIQVFAGGADNACGALGAGVIEVGKTMCSIGTSGVVLSYEADHEKDFAGKVHYFNHAVSDAFYTMGVTLAAGHSLTWFKETFAKGATFDELLADVGDVPAGSNGLLFTPYLSGERTPHADAKIRASFIGMDRSHERSDFVRAVLEGITFSLNESIELFREAGKTINTIVSIGGGAQNDVWLQMQADIFNAEIVKLTSEEGPGMGAAMLAAVGCGWFDSIKDCSAAFLSVEQTFKPNVDKVEQYAALFSIYKQVYTQTKGLNEQLAVYRK